MVSGNGPRSVWIQIAMGDLFFFGSCMPNNWIKDMFVKETKMTEQRVTGRIVKVSDKGFGFIISSEIPFTRIFFHWTSLTQDTLNFKELKKGMMAEFTPKEVEDKGTRAIKIKIVDTKIHPLTEEEEHAAEAE